MPNVFLVPETLAEGCQTHRGHYSYYLLYNKSNFDTPDQYITSIITAKWLKSRKCMNNALGFLVTKAIAEGY